MKEFRYSRAVTVEDAVRSYSHQDLEGHLDVRYIGGGTNLIDLMKTGVERPNSLIDVSRLHLSEIAEHEGGVRIGATVTNTACANSPIIRDKYPVLSQAILAGATQQLRNKATMAGNLLQRTRCPYFYDPTLGNCNKRTPGSGCSAIEGVNRNHAILGTSSECIATHPSDMCVALSAIGARVLVQGPKGSRTIPFSEFHRLPGKTPERDTNLETGELITAVELPHLPYTQSIYVKVRDRNSYAFALVSVAAIVDLDADGTIRKAHIALGGVAHKPWRAEEAESHLAGKKPCSEIIRAAASFELKAAKTHSQNSFKLELAKRAIVRAVMTAAGQGQQA
jgi:xanthine dehydrogenase YagS FAD-binding subunit